MSRQNRSNKKLNTEYILVTGGSGGIGFEVCKQLSNLGYKVIMCHFKNLINKQMLKKNKMIIPLKINLNKPSSINKAFLSLNSIIGKDYTFNKIILCASAAPEILPILKSNSKKFTEHFTTNVVGHYNLISKIINYYFKKKRLGKIVTILSKGIINENKPSKYMGPYLVSKAALKKLLQIIKIENNWIKIKFFYPGHTNTKMLRNLDKDYIKIIKKSEKIYSPQKISKQIIKEILI